VIRHTGKLEPKLIAILCFFIRAITPAMLLQSFSLEGKIIRVMVRPKGFR
jgi:hypothetical protein